MPPAEKPPAANARRVLVVDDELSMRRLLRVVLESGGYSMLEAVNGESALRSVALENPSLLVLDLGLPDLDGLEVLKRLRDWSAVPVLVLTARDQEAEKVALLDAGADDYLTKPFSAPELLARLRTLERHAQAPEKPERMVCGELEIDLGEHTVRRRGEPVRLTATEFAFLELLARNPGKVVTQREILRRVWGQEALEQTHYLRIYIGSLRKKLEDDPSAPRLLITEPGVGYRLKA